MSNQNKENKSGVWSWLFWWKLDKEEVNQQIQDYDKLKFTQSFRGIACLILLFFLGLTVILALIGWAPLDYAWSLVIYLPLIFFIYKGKRWAMVLMMILWTLERSASLVLTKANISGSIPPSGYLLSLVGWAVVMKGLYGALKVENIRMKQKSENKPAEIPLQLNKRGFTLNRVFIILISISILFLLWAATLRLLGYQFHKDKIATQPTPSPESIQPSDSPEPVIKEVDSPPIATREVEVTPQFNPDLVLLNLKTDINYNQNAMNTLLNAVYKNPNGACSSIIAQKTTQDHLYYMMQNFYNSKAAEYGQYRESVPGVVNTLNAFQNTLQIVKDRCAAIGYNID